MIGANVITLALMLVILALKPGMGERNFATRHAKRGMLPPRKKGGPRGLAKS